MRVFVTGSSGLVGSKLVKDLSDQNYEVYSGYHNEKPIHGNPIRIDLTKLEEIPKILVQTKPDVIIHLAGLTDVDLCESQQDLAMTLNAKATEVLAKNSAKHSIFFIYVSTDYVFDGTHGMRNEDDKPNPLECYGITKLEGEKSVQNFASNWCIARTSTLFGAHPKKKSLPFWVLENLQAKKEVKMVSDQFTSPTYVPNLSRMLIEVAKRKLEGIFHLAGATRISRYEMAKLVAEKLSLDINFLKPISLDEIDWKAKRPRDSSLDVSKGFSILREKPLEIDKAIDNLVRKIKLSSD